MGFDPMQQDKTINTISKFTTGPFLIMFGVGKGISGLVKSINKIFKDKEQEKLKALKVEMGTALKKYIETEILTAESSITTTYNREQ